MEGQSGVCCDRVAAWPVTSRRKGEAEKGGTWVRRSCSGDGITQGLTDPHAIDRDAVRPDGVQCLTNGLRLNSDRSLT